MTAQLTIRRVGGPLPTLRPSKTWALVNLDEPTRQAVLAFVASAGRQRSAAHAEAQSWVFELSAAAGGGTVSVPLTAIPEALRALLPGPGPR